MLMQFNNRPQDQVFSALIKEYCNDVNEEIRPIGYFGWVRYARVSRGLTLSIILTVSII
jgi:hypothetical protein